MKPRKIVEHASELLSRAAGKLNLQIASGKGSRAGLGEAAGLAREAAQLLDSLTEVPPPGKMRGN